MGSFSKIVYKTCLLATAVFSSRLNANEIDKSIEGLVAPIASVFSHIIFFTVPLGNDLQVPAVILWLIIAAVFFTFYFRFINLWGFKIAIDILRGKYKAEDAEGEVSHFQALTTALSGTVGVGNIGAIAIAVAIGGPGSVFWLIVAGFLGMTTKFVECSGRRFHSPSNSTAS